MRIRFEQDGKWLQCHCDPMKIQQDGTPEYFLVSNIITSEESGNNYNEDDPRTYRIAKPQELRGVLTKHFENEKQSAEQTREQMGLYDKGIAAGQDKRIERANVILQLLASNPVATTEDGDTINNV